MIQVSVEVRNGFARLYVAVRAESIERAVSLVGKRYPKGDVRVRFLDSESFFVKEPTARVGRAAFEQPETTAA